MSERTLYEFEEAIIELKHDGSMRRESWPENMMCVKLNRLGEVPYFELFLSSGESTTYAFPTEDLLGVDWYVPEPI